MVGKTIGNYSIEKRIGVGGMGEVYRAKDSRLGRFVAVKVLPAGFVSDPERAARFEREAKLLAALNHPNIAALYGIEEFDSQLFMIMELVEGDTLAERIARGPLPIREAMSIAGQIAEALEAAHAQGVVHRDLKPANVKITPEGKVKVLDFGLAKAMDVNAAAASANSPTIALSRTTIGTVLGTPAYMSPEQAKGLAADARSDIFSLGCVIYEMLAGQQAFPGDTVADIVAGVIAREPDLRVLPASFNPRIPMLLQRCLQKDPRQRWHAVGSARAEMEAILSDPRGLVLDAVLIPREPLWKRAIPLAAALIIGAAIAGFAAWKLKPKPDTPITQFSFALGQGQNFASPTHQLIAISPDGDSFVYAAGGQLHLKKGSEFKSTAIQGSALPGGAPVDPSFSPDGRSIAFFAPGDKTIKRIGADGGTPVTVCKADGVTGLTWFADGTPTGRIVFGQSGKGISYVSADGGTPEMTITIEKNQEPRNPQVLPGGKTVLFTLASGDQSGVVVQPLAAGGARKTIVEGASDARYAASAGRLLYARAGDVLSIAFNASRLETTGGSSPVAQSVYVGSKSGAAQFSFSDTGSMAYIAKSSTVQGAGSIALVDREGHVTPTGIPPGNYETPRVSPNGKQLAFGAYDGTGSNIWIYNLGDTKSMRKLTVSADGRYPLWSGDGERVLYQTARVRFAKLFWQRADGTGQAEQIADLNRQHRPTSWAPHSSLFLYSANLPNNGIGIIVTSVLDKKDTPFLTGPQHQTQGYFSPDGRWVVYQSDEGSKMDLYVETYPKTTDKFQITRDGGRYPVWSPDGKEVFFVNGGMLYSVGIQTKPTVTFANPVKLPVAGFMQDETDRAERNYDIMPDGKQFVMILPAGQDTEDTGPPPEIRGVFSWTAK